MTRFRLFSCVVRTMGGVMVALVLGACVTTNSAGVAAAIMATRFRPRSRTSNELICRERPTERPAAMLTQGGLFCWELSAVSSQSSAVSR